MRHSSLVCLGYCNFPVKICSGVLFVAAGIVICTGYFMQHSSIVLDACAKLVVYA